MAKTACIVLVVTVFLILSIFSSMMVSKGSAAVITPNHGVISIAFDDGTQSVYDNAFPLMQSRGITGTFYIITDKIRDFSLDSSYMNIAEIQALQANGNEIGSHSKTHQDFTTLPTNQIIDECRISKQVLQYYGLSANNFAYPYGVGITNTINSIVSQYYRSARVAYVSPGSNPIPTNQFQLIGYPGETGDTTALTRLKNFVNTIYSSNVWAVIYFHNVVPNAVSTPYTISTSDFSQFLDYVISKGVQTLTVNQALNLAPNPSPTPSFTPTAPSPLGKTTKGAMSARQPVGEMIGSRFTSLSNGVASSISVYLTNQASSSSYMKCAIYKESDKTLLAVTQEAAIQGGYAGWQTFQFQNAPSLIGGASYSIVAWFGSGNLLISYDTGWERQSWYAYQTYGNFASGSYSSQSVYNQENTAYSLYCTFNPTAATTPSQPPSQFVFGQTVKGDSGAWQPSNVIVGSRFACSSSGSSVSISVYISNPTASSIPARCAIYQESDKTQLATTEEKIIPSGFNGWQTFNLVSKPLLTAGASYSLAVTFGGSGCLIYYKSGNFQQSWYGFQPYGTISTGPYNGLSLYNQENNVYSLYCTISPT